MKIHSNIFFRTFSILLIICIAAINGNSQTESPVSGGVSRDASGRPISSSRLKGEDSLAQRDSNEDSITLYYRMFDSSRTYRIDSTVDDYTRRFPMPAQNIYLNNLGSPTRSMIFSPFLKPGFDPGFHGYDTYKFSVENTRIFQTTRPYTELDYLLGSKSEQTIKILHTQNINPYWNALFEYRFINSPGFVKNSNTVHSAIRFSTSFSSKNRRYSGSGMFITNRNRSSENGGIVSEDYLKDPIYSDRFNIPTWLGGDGSYGSNFFTSSVTTGTEQKSRTFFLRHQYDFGQKDSTYDADSAVVHIFYPRLRFMHQFSYTSSMFKFADAITTDVNYNEIYKFRYGVTLVSLPLSLNDKWDDIINEAAFEIFPEKNNQDQFLKAGAGYQMLQGDFNGATENFNNLYLLGEYRNRTRNRKWDVQANGRFFLAGLNGADYNAGLSLERQLGKRFGSLQVSFQNVNRTPSFVFDPRSSFLYSGDSSLNKENWIVLGGNLYLNSINLRLLGKYYVVSNYTYWDNYYHARQQGTLQNILHLGAEKRISITKRWKWYAEVHFQKGTGSDINLPLIYTRNRFVYEGKFYKNLVLASGFEVRYFTPFNADDWSPFNHQWVVQNSQSISNRPDIAAFAHIRIRGCRIYARVENLNTVNFSNGFSFTNNNLAAPLYPTPGFVFRLGIYWAFVN